MPTEKRSFHFACPGELYFGKNCVKNNADVFTRYGKKAFIITSKFPTNCKNQALEDVCAALESVGMSYEIIDNAEEDPSVESAVAMVPQVEAFKPDIMIAIGGGSVMDTVKSINVMRKYPEKEPYDALFDNGEHVFGVGGDNEGLVPFYSVATTAGTGADLTGVAVMTRADVDNKCGTNHRDYARYVFTDPTYIIGAPKKLNHATAIDALCHGIEAYVSAGSQDDYMTNIISEAAFSLFRSYKDRLLTHTMTEEDYANQALHSMLQGVVIINEVTGVPHGLGYPLSHIYHVPHGLACGVFEAEYLRIFKNTERVDKVVKLCGFNNIDEFCDYIQDILAPHINLKITHKEIDEWTDVFYGTPWRLARHPEPITREMVHEMYERALAKFIAD